MNNGTNRRRPLTTVARVCSCTLAFGACELEEVVVPPSDPIVIVQAIMRPDRAQQWILVERSLTGETSPLRGGGRVLPQGSVSTPVAGAVVTVTNASRPGDPCGSTVTFTEALAPDTTIAGTYWAPQGCPVVLPGDTLDLQVVSENAVVTGRTIVPITGDIMLHAMTGSVTLPGPTIAFNRDVDTLTAEVRATGGRGLYLSVHPRQLTAGREHLVASQTSWFFADSTALRLPGDFVNIFEADFEFDDDVPDLFDAGRHYEVTVARPDTNYYDFLRSGNSPLSGRGFINRLDGGFGLFGSMIVAGNALRAVGTIDDPRERAYRYTGEVEGVQVDLLLEIYVGRPLLNDADDRSRFAAFATGTWVHGPLDQSVNGLLRGNSMDASLEQGTGTLNEGGSPATQLWTIRGNLSPDSGRLTVVSDQGQIETLVQVPPSG